LISSCDDMSMIITYGRTAFEEESVMWCGRLFTVVVVMWWQWRQMVSQRWYLSHFLILGLIIKTFNFSLAFMVILRLTWLVSKNHSPFRPQRLNFNTLIAKIYILNSHMQSQQPKNHWEKDPKNNSSSIGPYCTCQVFYHQDSLSGCKINPICN